MSFVILSKKDPKKLQNSWSPSLETVHISLVGWDQGGRSAGLLCRNALASQFEDQGDFFSRLHLLFLYTTQIQGLYHFTMINIIVFFDP